MEDQTEEKAVFVKSGKATVSPISSLNSEEYDGAIFPLPEWTSQDGFKLLEDFVETISNASVKNALFDVLKNGRGVFKNFKNVLKTYPQISARFSKFKNRKMKKRVFEWYSLLFESWRLEGLSIEGLDDSFEDLVDSDFLFEPCDFLKDEKSKREVLEEHEKIAQEFFCEKEFGAIFGEIWRGQKIFVQNPRGFLCRTLSRDFVGCIVYGSVLQNPTDARESVALTTCFVNESFRGLGIARKLVSLCCKEFSDLAKNGKKSDFFVFSSIIPENFSRVLLDLGFVQVRSIFVARFF